MEWIYFPTGSTRVSFFLLEGNASAFVRRMYICKAAPGDLNLLCVALQQLSEPQKPLLDMKRKPNRTKIVSGKEKDVLYEIFATRILSVTD